MNKYELLPCPFCGNNEITVEENYMTNSVVRCWNFDGKGCGVSIFGSIEEVYYKWNNRSTKKGV